MNAALFRLCLLLTSVASCAGTNEAGKKFLEENAWKAGWVTLDSGLQYKIVESGPSGGKTPLKDSPTECHYEGSTIDGTVFDSR
jgi:FKBP-type peptidyl-prolyl cis-trans isomerase